MRRVGLTPDPRSPWSIGLGGVATAYRESGGRRTLAHQGETPRYPLRPHPVNALMATGLHRSRAITLSFMGC